MAEDLQSKKIPPIFFRTLTGSEPVREWFKEPPEEERQAVGKDLFGRQGREAASIRIELRQSRP